MMFTFIYQSHFFCAMHDVRSVRSFDQRSANVSTYTSHVVEFLTPLPPLLWSMRQCAQSITFDNLSLFYRRSSCSMEPSVHVPHAHTQNRERVI